MMPDDKPLTLREGSRKKVLCVVNSNAVHVPAPTFTWYLGSTNITSKAGSDTASIIITGIRLDNAMTLQCTATNNNKPPKSSSTTLNVEYPPVVSTLVQQDIIEGRGLLVTCQATPGNPSSTTFFWTKVDDLGFRNNGTNLQLFNIQRTSTGTYRCTGENTYSNGDIGKHSQDMVVNILYKPSIEIKPPIIVNETETVVLKLKVDSNPLSDMSWYNGVKLLQTQTFVETTTLIIKDMTCLDSKNFTFVASNIVQSNVTSHVEVIVNCKPKPEHTEIIFAIPSTPVRVTFSTSVVAYPELRYLLKYENGTTNNEMTVTLYRNSINNFTIQFEQQNMQENHLGVYVLEVSNFLGQSTILLHIIKQGKPRSQTVIAAECDVTSARIKWISSYNGGAVQSFFVVAMSDSYQTGRSKIIVDKGENQTHQATVSFLQPSVLYTFYVFARNSYGVSLSDAQNCSTSKETLSTSTDSKSQTSVVSGSIVGVLVLLTLLIVLTYFIFKQRFTEGERNMPLETADLSYDKSVYTTITEEQSENIERNPYDSLTPKEDTKQYEALQMTDNQEINTNAYQCLEINVSSCDYKKMDSKTSGIVKKKNTESSPETLEEYENTSFVK